MPDTIARNVRGHVVTRLRVVAAVRDDTLQVVGNVTIVRKV